MPLITPVFDTGAVGGAALTCELLKPQAQPLSDVVEIWRVAGVDGVGAMVLGKADSLLQFTLTQFFNTADLGYGFIDDVNRRKGLKISIKDELDHVHTNCLIVEVGQAAPKACIKDGSKKFRVDIPVRAVKTA